MDQSNVKYIIKSIFKGNEGKSKLLNPFREGMPRLKAFLSDF